MGMRNATRTTKRPSAPERAPRRPAPPPPHHSNPALADALFATASGDRLTVVIAPPGSGKTFLITHLAHQLATRMQLRVAVAAQTREQSYDVANRIARLGVPTRHLRGRHDHRPRGLDDAVASLTTRSVDASPGVTIATSARWRVTATTQFRADILLVDEAYQMTYADLIAIGDLADQVALVGDPGQIAPVVTGETRRWQGNAAGPHVPAPAALASTHPDSITSVRMSTTHRLGPQTTDLISPLYPTLPFTSARTPSHITLDGTQLPEHRPLPMSTRGDHTDPALATTAADTARRLLTGTLTTTDGSRPMKPTDLAVITPHVHQAALVAANLSDLPGILVATANAAQGLKRHAVVALHPLAGNRETPTFALDLGRLCVTLSRHRSHLTVITDDRTPDLLRTAQADATGSQAEALALHRGLLAAL